MDADENAGAADPDDHAAYGDGDTDSDAGSYVVSRRNGDHRRVPAWHGRLQRLDG
jgi:hypothetical protein